MSPPPGSDYGAEARYTEPYHARGEPRVGLALSGGGTRSASFCIGVLKGLQEEGVLGNVDIISSVSGGSYASYWYFSQHYYRRTAEPSSAAAIEADIFRTEWQPKDGDRPRTNLDDPSGYQSQRFLAHGSRILNIEHRPGFLNTWVLNPLTLVWTVSDLLVSLPFHWVMNGVFDWEVPPHPARCAYLHGLERTYGQVPADPNLKHFLNEGGGVWKRVPLIREAIPWGKPLTLDELRAFLVEQQARGQRLPYFVINTTGGVGTDVGVPKANEPGMTMGSRIYEFTPWSFGSSLFGYAPAAELSRRLTMAKIVAASGAAVDRQYAGVEITGESMRHARSSAALLDVLNLNLGYFVSNPNAPTAPKVLQNLLPWPLYWGCDLALQKAMPNRPLSVSLSDGGHSDNLGAYSLIRRGVERIIIVDAERDPNSEFVAAHRLRKQIREEWGCTMEFEQEQPLDVYNAPIKASIIRGTITQAPSWPGNLQIRGAIQLWYIKLSMDRTLLRDDSQPVFDPGATLTGGLHRYPDNVQRCARHDAAFPHNSTADVFFSPDQFRAYRDLGYIIVKANADKLSALKPTSP
jgi:hypothetical protein